jgi:Leucine-rich repeat (LRR) protein
MKTTNLQRVAVACGAVWLGFSAEPTSAAIPASERAALIALYNSTNGAGWYCRDNWRNAEDADFALPGTECTWCGVTCDATGSHVSRLDLAFNNMDGSIPPEIGNLTSLLSLSLSSNPLSGSIPPEVGNLTSLLFLDVGGSQLSGSIPPQIGNLTSLEYLGLGANLSGPIPPEIGNLSQLSWLHLHDNQLSGSIPPEIGNLSRLTELWLEGNQLSGPIPPEIGNLTKAMLLYLDRNQLSGPIPPEIGNLSQLAGLYLSSNELSGSIPPEIGNLSQLETLYLSSNELSGSIPPEIGRLSQLSWLCLNDNQLSGSIPPGIGNLSRLRNLDLSVNQLSGPVPPAIANLANADYLYLDHNQLGGPLPPEVGNLHLGGGQAYSPGVLRLDYNQLSGSIPPEIGGLVIGGSMGTGELYLDHNLLSGPIPSEIGNLSHLGTLALNDNQLSGPIPPEIGNLSHLSTLRLQGNQLSGSIPAEIGNLTSLEYLYLSNNQLSGSIPPEIGKLVMGDPTWELGGLYLDHNQLSGPIPSAIGNVKYLGTLALNDNQLSGSIPPEIGNLGYLSALRLLGNQLRGPIPATLGSLTKLLDDLSDLRWNALYTNDAALGAFLDSKQIGGDWQGTQTIAATGLAAGPPGPDGVPLRWTPILYVGDAGGYRSWYGTIPGGPYNLAGMTADKAIGAFGVSGLSPGTTYYFALDTVTEPHANNQNTVVSERTGEVMATTGPGGVGWHGLTVVRQGLGAVSSSPEGIACGGACSATFAPGTPVTLTAVPDAGSTFLGWGGACGGTALTCDLTMDSEQTATATFSTPAESYYTVSACRLFDSRDPGLGGPVALGAGTDNAVLVGGCCGIPATAKAVSLNMTVVSPSTGGHLRLYPSGTPRPTTSSINYAASQTRANNAVVSLGADGSLTVYVNQPSGTTHVVIDVSGYLQ